MGQETNTLPNLRKAMGFYYQIHKPAIRFSFENCSDTEDLERSEEYERRVLKRLQDALLLDTSEYNSEEKVRLIGLYGLESMVPEDKAT